MFNCLMKRAINGIVTIIVLAVYFVLSICLSVVMLLYSCYDDPFSSDLFMVILLVLLFDFVLIVGLNVSNKRFSVVSLIVHILQLLFMSFCAVRFVAEIVRPYLYLEILYKALIAGICLTRCKQKFDKLISS